MLAFVAFNGLAPAHAENRYGERAVAELVEIAGSEKEPENRRARAIRELEHTTVRTQISVLRRLLREERSEDLRVAAACTLAALGDSKAPLDLLLVTAYDGKRTATCSRGEILIALGRTGSPSGEFHLQRALQASAPTDEPYYHSDVCRAIHLLGTPGARKLLLDCMRDGSPEYRLAAVKPLTQLCLDRKEPFRNEAADLLRSAARRDPDEKVAEQAASALFWDGIDGAAVYRMLEADTEPRVRARAARAIGRQQLSLPRLERLRLARSREKDPNVQAAIDQAIKDGSARR
jgi:HEAT repeat protein